MDSKYRGSPMKIQQEIVNSFFLLENGSASE